MPAVITHDLTIRLDEDKGQLQFLATRRPATKGYASVGSQPLTVEIVLNELKGKSIAEAERLIGASVLGFFDHLTEGRLDLPRNYRED